MSRTQLVLAFVDHAAKQARAVIVPPHLVSALSQANGLFLGRNDGDYPREVHMALDELLDHPNPTLEPLIVWAARGVPVVTVTIDVLG